MSIASLSPQSGKVRVDVTSRTLAEQVERDCADMEPAGLPDTTLHLVQWPACKDALQTSGDAIVILLVNSADAARASRLIASGEVHGLVDEEDLDARSLTRAWHCGASVAELERRGKRLSAAKAELAATLKEQHDRLRHITEGAIEAVWVLDVDEGRYTFAVNRLAQTLGYREDEVGADLQWWRQRMHPEDQARAAASAREHMKRGGRTRMDYRMQCKDGTYRWCRTHAHITSVEPPVRVFGFVEMIDDLKKREKEIEHLHQELLTAHRQAGMAEVASGVLHNVGNALNSINTSAQSVLEGLRQVPVGKLERVLQMLAPEQAAADPERTRTALQYVQQLSGHISLNCGRWIADAERIVQGVDHVSQSISRQQSYATGMGGIYEPVALDELVADMVDLHLSTHSEIRTVCDLQPAPDFLIDKHKVVQIIINLLRNAKHATQASRREDKEIRVTLRITDIGNALLTVADNGVGISEDDGARLFEYGFTTKARGHGFGLHASSLAIQEMGGTITFASDGPGRGATFTLTVPADHPARDGQDARLITAA